MDDYIANLAKRISKKDDFLVVPVNHDTVNAFAHFGGVIGMMGGLWLYCENEGEFAAILAHEMAHVKQEHFKRREEQSKETTALLIPLILGGLLVDDEEAREALTIGGLGILGSVITGYTREMEQEADAIAVGLLRKGGFNPRALADVLGRFQGGGGIAEYISTHPAPGRRSADVIARAKPDDPNAREEVDFYFLREKLRAGFNPGNKTKRLRVCGVEGGQGGRECFAVCDINFVGSFARRGVGRGDVGGFGGNGGALGGRRPRGRGKHGKPGRGGGGAGFARGLARARPRTTRRFWARRCGYCPAPNTTGRRWNCTTTPRRFCAIARP